MPTCDNATVAVAIATLKLTPPEPLPTRTLSKNGELNEAKMYVKWTKAVKAANNQTEAFLASNRRVLPSVRVLPAVNGFNHTEVIEALLRSGLRFRSLSAGGKKWGKIATFLTKYRALQQQVRDRVPYQLLLEDDVLLYPSVLPFLGRACDYYNAHPDLTVMQLSRYGEALLFSLAGAQQMIRKIDEFGILRSADTGLEPHPHPSGRRHSPRALPLITQSLFACRASFSDDDQQLLDWRIMSIKHVRMRPKLGEAWTLGRGTNSAGGHIYRSRKVTWAEMAMLRLLTARQATLTLPSFGNPSFTDLRAD